MLMRRYNVYMIELEMWMWVAYLAVGLLLTIGYRIAYGPLEIFGWLIGIVAWAFFVLMGFFICMIKIKL